MSPEGTATFGWKILVRKNPLGGVYGKSDPITSLHRKMPPWNGVSTKKNKLDPNRKLTWSNDVSLDVHNIAVLVLVENYA